MLGDYRVVDLSDERGHLAGQILRQLGAEVIAVEPPGGSSARRLVPFAGDVEDPERSLHHWSYNRGKRSVVLDLETADGRAELHRLVAGADMLIETLGSEQRSHLGLEPHESTASNPALIHVSITAFGTTGPKADWASSDLTIQAACGNMVLTGDKDRPPLRVGTLPQAFHNAASEAAAAVLVALYERQTRSGLGQHIDVSAQQSMNQCAQSMMLAVPYNAAMTTRIAGGANLQGIDIQLMWPCKDGYASVTLLFGLMIAPFTQNLLDWVCEEGFCDEATRDKNWVDYAVMLLDGREPVAEYERVKGVLTDFFATKTKAELLEASLSRRVLIAPVWNAEDVLASDQFASRGYWEHLEHPDLGPVRYPGAFARFSATPLEPLSPAPTLGADTESVLAEPPRTPSASVTPGPAPTEPPLRGLKVLDLTWVIAGPAASRVLADYGAEIVRIESETRPDGARTLQPFRDNVTDPHYSGLWNNMNAGKRELSLNLAKPGASDVVWDLVEWADVVLEAFSPGSLARMGLSPEAMLERKPGIIVASTCLMGQTGPLAELAGFGTMAAAISGFFHPVGWPDRAPCGPFGAYTDYTSPRWFVAAILAAVEHRRATGVGQHIDFSQAESAMHLLGPALLERGINGRTWERAGNTDLVHAPHGVYPADGDDRWIAVACTNQAEWRALADLLARPDLRDLERAERKQRENELDELVLAWTSRRDAVAAMEALQASRIPSHVVQNSDEASVDPQLLHRGHFVEVAHSTQPGGTTFVEGTRFVLSRTPAAITTGGPTFGEHSFEILTEILGYDGDRIADLAAAEALE